MDYHIMQLFYIGSLAEWITAGIAFFALAFTYIQIKSYRKQGRIELLNDYNKRLFINNDLKVVCKYIEKACGLKHHYEVPEPDDHQIEVFMRFFEEIELLIAEKAMDEETAYYMFSYYSLEFDKRKGKWKNVDYDSEKWKIYRHFIKRMKVIQDDKAVNPKL